MTTADKEYSFTDTDAMLAALDDHIEPMWPAKEIYDRQAAIVESFLKVLGARSGTIDSIIKGGDQMAYHDWHRSRSRAIED